MASRMAGVAVSKMTSMGEAGMLFSTVMELLTAWLEDLGPLADHVGDSCQWFIRDAHE